MILVRLHSGKSLKAVIRPDFNRAIRIDFRGAQITSDTGFLLVREIDERFSITRPMGDCLEDLRCPKHTRHSLVQMIRQRVERLIKVGARVSYHARSWDVHVASAFPLSHRYRAVLAWGP